MTLARRRRSLALLDRVHVARDLTDVATRGDVRVRALVRLLDAIPHVRVDAPRPRVGDDGDPVRGRKLAAVAAHVGTQVRLGGAAGRPTLPVAGRAVALVPRLAARGEHAV